MYLRSRHLGYVITCSTIASNRLFAKIRYQSHGTPFIALPMRSPGDARLFQLKYSKRTCNASWIPGDLMSSARMTRETRWALLLACQPCGCLWRCVQLEAVKFRSNIAQCRSPECRASRFSSGKHRHRRYFHIPNLKRYQRVLLAKKQGCHRRESSQQSRRRTVTRSRCESFCDHFSSLTTARPAAVRSLAPRAKVSSRRVLTR